MNIFELLQTTRSLLEKEIMLSHATIFERRVFQYAYNPELTFGVTFGDADVTVSTESPLALEAMFDILNRLASRELSGGAARAAVDKYAFHNGQLIKAICNKDLRCGVTATTLNKAFGKDFIPKHKIQKAMEVPLDKLSYPLLAQVKYNGVRVTAHMTAERVIFKSSGGHEFEFPKLESLMLMNLAPGFVYDGELCVGDSKGLDHTSVSGYQNSALKGTPISADGLRFNIFDCLTLAEFASQKCNLPYEYRLTLLKSNMGFRTDVGHLTSIRIDEGKLVNNHQEAQQYFEDLYSQGYEGLILKSLKHKYEFKRSKVWVKVKAVKDADLTVVDIQEGENKYTGLIGGLVCQGIVEGKIIEVTVGSGLSDLERAYDYNEFIGKVVEVKYNEVIIDNKTGEYSLFLPRFIRVRHDK
jgi:DNA ligase-1